MSRTFDQTGIMFSSPFPTLSELDATHNYFSLLPTGIAVPDELADWRVVAVDPRGWLYGDDDQEAMDETNFDAICDAVGSDIHRFADLVALPPRSPSGTVPLATVPRHSQ